MTTDVSARPTPAQVDGSGHVLDLIRRGEATTVSQMAQAIGVSRSTMMQRLTRLERVGLVRGEMHVVGARGRPAATYAFAPEAGTVLAAQVGMSGCRTLLTDLSGEVLDDRFVEIGATTGPEELLAALLGSFDDLLSQSPADPSALVGLGIGMPSLLELRASARAVGDREKWDLRRLQTAVEERYARPVFLDLDVNMLALAEHRMSWPHTEVLVCLKLGTAIDASLVIRGEPVRGAHGLAGELGHVKVDGQDEPCGCGSRGCLDAVASGAALVRRLNAEGLEVERVTDVMRLADDGSPQAMQAVRDAGRHIGATLASVVNLLNPAAITAWGYLTESELLFAGIRESLYAGALPASTRGLELLPTSLGVLAGARGAALRAIDEILSPTNVDRSLVDGYWATSSADR